MGVNLRPEAFSFAVEVLKFQSQTTEAPIPGSVRNGSVEEKCITEGEHKILSFITEVQNVGTADLIIGKPENRPDIYERVPHTKSGWITKEVFYLYSLKDEKGNVVARGSKRAWCIMDHNRFNCDFQGISVGDHDEYGTKEHCQFLVIDNIPDGLYTFEVTINPKKIFEEDDYLDNTVTKTIRILGPVALPA